MRRSFPTAVSGMTLWPALRLRRDVLRLDDVTDAYRVVHAEADGFSGLVVDRLGDTLSAEVFSLGMFQRCREILERLQPLCGTRHRLIQPGPHVLAQEAFSAEPQASSELPSSVVIQEYGTRFRVHFEQGHKTGFFCDQRDNRRQLASYCAGRSVLDLCCYTGGFAIQAKRLGQAAEVIGVDLDEQPLRLARQNARSIKCKSSSCKPMCFRSCAICSAAAANLMWSSWTRPSWCVREPSTNSATEVLRPEPVGHAIGATRRNPADLHLFRPDARRRIPPPGVLCVAAGGAARPGGRGRIWKGYTPDIARPGQDRRRRRSSGGRPLPGDGYLNAFWACLW